MAKRKRTRRAHSLGFPAVEHREIAKALAREASHDFKQMVKTLNQGKCREAMDWLLNFAATTGSAKSHQVSTGRGSKRAPSWYKARRAALIRLYKTCAVVKK